MFCIEAWQIFMIFMTQFFLILPTLPSYLSLPSVQVIWYIAPTFFYLLLIPCTSFNLSKMILYGCNERKYFVRRPEADHVLVLNSLCTGMDKLTINLPTSHPAPRRHSGCGSSLASVEKQESLWSCVYVQDVK